MTALRLGVLAQPIARPDSIEAWEAIFDARVAEGARGADLLLMPEYGCVEAAAIGGVDASGPDIACELDRMRALAPRLIEAMRATARRRDVWLAPGSLPIPAGDATLNRAPLIAPDGRIAWQDKRVMTRFEDEQWRVSPGAPPGVFETDWGRIGLSICFDVEFPTLVRAQVEAGAWLILAPSCTDTVAGFNRVRLSARARALENQCFVAVAPTVGEAPWLGTLDVNRGRACVFGPVDRGFPEDGMIATGALDQPGWIFATLDPARIETVRREGGVFNHASWPGPLDVAAPIEWTTCP